MAAQPNSIGKREDAYMASNLATESSLTAINYSISVLSRLEPSDIATCSILDQLSDESLLRSLANATERAPALARRMARPEMQQSERLRMLTADWYLTCAKTTKAACLTLPMIMSAMLAQVEGADLASPSPPASPPRLIPPEAMQLLAPVERSRLLPAICKAVLDFPPPSSIPDLDPEDAQRVATHMGAAATGLPEVLGSGLFQVATRLVSAAAHDVSNAAAGAPREELWRQVDALLRVLSDGGPELVRMQRALLEWLAERGGQEGEAGAGRRGRGGGGGGCWALPLDGPTQLATLPGPEAAEHAEQADCRAMSGSVGLWCAAFLLQGVVRAAAEGAQRQRPAPATAAVALPVPAPSELAALAVRAARALCRLGRGEGRGGGYRQGEWRGPDSEHVFTSLHLLLGGLRPVVPPAEARAMQAGCLEAGAWAVAWAVQVVPGSPLRAPPAGEQPPGFVLGRPLLARLLVQLRARAADERYGLDRVSPAARADCSARASAAGLPRALDYALRLACDEAERLAAQGAEARAEAGMEDTAAMIGGILKSGLVSMLPVGGSDNSNAAGLLVTACKRARLLTGRLEALPQGPPPATAAAAVAEWRLCGPLLREASNLLAIVPVGMEIPSDWYAAGCPAPGAADGSADPRVAPLSAELEARSLALRCSCALVAATAHAVARLLRALPPGAEREELAAVVEELDPAFLAAMLLVKQAAAGETPLPAAHVLAAQPHRLIAAMCGMIPAMDAFKATGLAVTLQMLLLTLSRHEQLEPHMLEWLEPPPGPSQEASARAGAGTSSGGGRRPPLSGCLRSGMVRCVSLLMQFDRVGAMALVRGLRLSPDTGSGASGESVCALPPAVPVPPADVALPQLRLCGNPACSHFGGAAEADCKPKLCGGCRRVRYCRPECQRAHWLGAHKGECRLRAGE